MKQYTTACEDIRKNEWTTAYHFWVSERGAPIKVKPLKYIGFRGWDNYIYKKEYNGIIYCGETWLCEDEYGNQSEYNFRKIYSDDMESEKANQQFKFTYRWTGVQLEEINAHSDGFEAFIHNNFKLRPTLLLDNQNQKLAERIDKLKKLFKNLNNIENPLMKLGVQLYLRRLETPTMQTSREWKQYGIDHPYLKSQILDQL